MKNSFSSDLQRFMLTPTKFPLSQNWFKRHFKNHDNLKNLVFGSFSIQQQHPLGREVD